MGAASSKAGKSSGILLTLDAFGTLYRPKEPIAQQYLRWAHSHGLKRQIELPELESSFRKAFAEQIERRPNYGKSTGMEAREWWRHVVNDTFSPYLHGSLLPPGLADRLYSHFSSRDAYELYPDVKPLFQTLRQLRQKYLDPNGPIIVVGIVTNSDERVTAILRSLDILVGKAKWDPGLLSLHAALMPIYGNLGGKFAQARNERRSLSADELVGTQEWYQWWNPELDIDEVVTSYDLEIEKPDERIWKCASVLAGLVMMSRAGKNTGAMGVLEMGRMIMSQALSSQRLTHIHVGNDFWKDYQGAKDGNLEALHLRRDLEPGEHKDHEIGNLHELATYVVTMAEMNFGSRST